MVVKWYHTGPKRRTREAWAPSWCGNLIEDTSGHTKAGSSRRVPRWLWSILALVVLGAIAYWNSFDVPFVFDDLLSIQRNAGVRFGDFLSPSVLGQRPLLYLTFSIDYALHGLDVWGYHVGNLLFHLLNGILVFFIGQHIFRLHSTDERRTNVFALLAAAFFIVHPVQTESVTYISSRSELVSTFFYALAFLVFIKTPKRYIGFLLSLLVGFLGFLGILSKETVITLPASLVLYDFLFLSESQIRQVLSRWRFYITFVIGAALAIYKLVTVMLVGAIGKAEGNLPPWNYFLTQTRVVTKYVQLVFFPLSLNLDYDFKPSGSLLEPRVLAASLFLLTLIAAGWFLRRRQPIAAFSIFWFFITLSPTSSFVPILDVIFEHRLYLPMVGVCLSFPLVLQFLMDELQKRWRYSVQPQYCCWGIVLIPFSSIRADVLRECLEPRLGHQIVETLPHNTSTVWSALDALRRSGHLIKRDRRYMISAKGEEYLRRFKERDVA